MRNKAYKIQQISRRDANITFPMTDMIPMNDYELSTALQDISPKTNELNIVSMAQISSNPLSQTGNCKLHKTE